MKLSCNSLVLVLKNSLKILTRCKLDRRLLLTILVDIEKVLSNGESDDYGKFSKLGLQNEPEHASFLLRNGNSAK